MKNTGETLGKVLYTSDEGAPGITIGISRKKVKYGYIIAKPVYNNYSFSVYIHSNRLKKELNIVNKSAVIKCF